MRICSTCKVAKDASQFYINRDHKDGLCNRCKQCDREYVLKWAKDNPKRINARNLKWAKEHPEITALRTKNWQIKNRERLSELARLSRAKDPSKNKIAMKKWQKKNKAILTKNVGARRAARIMATPKWLSAIDKALIQEFYDISLAKYMQTGIVHNVDHIIPLRGENVCGLHVPLNLQVIPAIENFKKGNSVGGLT